MWGLFSLLFHFDLSLSMPLVWGLSLISLLWFVAFFWYFRCLLTGMLLLFLGRWGLFQPLIIFDFLMCGRIISFTYWFLRADYFHYEVSLRCHFSIFFFDFQRGCWFSPKWCRSISSSLFRSFLFSRFSFHFVGFLLRPLLSFFRCWYFRGHLSSFLSLIGRQLMMLISFLMFHFSMLWRWIAFSFRGASLLRADFALLLLIIFQVNIFIYFSFRRLFRRSRFLSSFRHFQPLFLLSPPRRFSFSLFSWWLSFLFVADYFQPFFDASMIDVFSARWLNIAGPFLHFLLYHLRDMCLISMLYVIS